MPEIAEFSIPAESFALGQTLSQFPDVAVEADRIVAHAPGTTMPAIWATDGRAPGFEAAMAEDETVEEIRASASFDDEHLFHVQWTEEVEAFVGDVVDHAGTVLEASATDEQWVLRIRFMTREQFRTFQREFTDQWGDFRLTQLFSVKYPRHTRGDVTSEQYEALTTAAEMGYYAVPNQASTEEVANELGISPQAVSERLRRGTENLIRDMMFIEPIQTRG